MSQQHNRTSPATLLYSYAHEDEARRDELEKHLGLLRRQGFLSTWSNRQIMPGIDWSKAIDTHLSSASIILLLISSDFLNSDYCYGIEMQRALERHQRGEVHVVPIILRPCDWRTSPFAHLQCLPHDGKALTTWENQDEAFLAIAQGLRQIIERQQIPAHPLSEVERQKRRSLIKRVRTTWIEGVLQHSLHQAVLIALDLQEQPDALANPWRLEVQETDLPPCLLPAGTSIVQVYDKADGELLILGEPGAGKTTLLLELARTLLEQAEEKEQERLPVVFNLSSWAQGRQSLAVWLVEELWTKYQVPCKLGQVWIDGDQILPLLDGLDEVAENVRSACVEAINAYYHHHLEQGPAPLIVCCRSQEYLALPTRVNLHQAVSVQPLTDEQIEHYLQSTRGQLEALRHALRNDPELYELAHRPLMLSIFTLAYQGASSENLPTEGTREVQQRQVFATYVERMLTRRGASRHVFREPALRWLAFLAAQMQQHHQTAFYLEHLQPSWLVDKRMQWEYDWLAVRLPYMLIGMLVSLAPYPLFFPDILTPFLLEVILLGGLLGWLLGGGNATQPSLAGNGGKVRGWPWYWLLQQLGLATLLGSGAGLSFWKGSDLLSGLVAGLSFGACCLLLMLLLRTRNTLQTPMQPTPQQHPSRGKVVLNALLVGLLVGLSSASAPGTKSRIAVGLLFLLLGGLSGGILNMLLIGRHTAIQPTDRLIWTWQSFSRSLFSKRHVRSTLQITGIGLLLFSTIIWLMGGSTIGDILAIGLVFGLCYWLLLGFFRGVETTTIDDQLRVVPNQGIRHSALNALRYGLVVAILIGLGGALLFPITLTCSLIIGLSIGLLAGLFNGGLACLRHYILRILLWRSGATPWDYQHFLDAVAKRILLCKVGGGYIFLHRLLLDYLATLGTNE